MPLQELNDRKVTTIHELGCCVKTWIGMLHEKASAFRWGFEKNRQPEVQVMWRIGFRKWNSLWQSICQKWRSCEESASGSGIHCDEAATKSKAAAACLVKVALCKMLLDQWRNFIKIYVHRMNISHRADAGLALTFIDRTYTLRSMYESRTWYSILSRISFCFAN
jgi:hypothetical protein